MLHQLLGNVGNLTAGQPRVGSDVTLFHLTVSFLGNYFFQPDKDERRPADAFCFRTLI